MIKPPNSSVYIILIGIIAMSGLLLWGRTEIIGVEKASYEVLSKGTKAIFSSLKGSIASEISRGHFNKNRLTEVVEGIFKELDLSYIAINTKDETLIRLGNISGNSEFNSASGERFSDNIYYLWGSVSAVDCNPGSYQRYRGGNGGNSRAYSNKYLGQTFKVILGVDSHDYKIYMAEGKSRMYMLLITGCSTLLLLALSYIISVHSVTLKSKLNGVEERNCQFEEFELAAYGLAHETKHPLGIMRARAQQIFSIADLPDIAKPWAEDIMEEADVTATRLAEFMSYAKIQAPQLQECSWPELCDKLDFVLKPDFDHIGAELFFERLNVTLTADVDMLQRVLINLITNSLPASSRGKTTHVEVSQVNNSFQIVVRDDGAGMSPMLLKDTFTPYVSGTEGGHGIGLSIVKRIIEAHGWDISVESEVNIGTSFKITGIAGIQEK